MVTSPSRLSYLECYTILDRAMASNLGLRLTFPDVGAARSFQLRLNKARRINRDDNAEVYDASHPLYGASEYDTLTIRLKANGAADGSGTVLVIEKVDREMQIEEIEE